MKEDEPISIPGLGADVAAHSSRFWRDALRLRQGEAGRVTAIGPVVNKFIFHDATSFVLPDATSKATAILSEQCYGTFSVLLKTVTRNPPRQHPEVDSALKLLAPDAEARIRDGLNRLNDTQGDGSPEHMAFLRDVFEPVMELVVASVVPGSPLRRSAAQNQAKALLDEHIRALVQSASHPSTADPPRAVPAKAKTRPRERGKV